MCRESSSPGVSLVESASRSSSEKCSSSSGSCSAMVSSLKLDGEPGGGGCLRILPSGGLGLAVVLGRTLGVLGRAAQAKQMGLHLGGPLVKRMALQREDLP